MAKQTLIDKFIRDKHGKITLWQTPNWPIIAWVGFKVLSYFLPWHSAKSGFGFMSTAALIVWAYLEITSGVNYARRLLGIVVLVVTILPHF